MTIKEIFELAIQIGIDNDPRGRAKVEKMLKKRKADYDELPEKKKKDYDTERLKNPYSDSAIQYVSDPNTNVKKILVGIDIEPAEMILAYELNKKNEQKIDLVIAHHPMGKSLANLGDVMDMQTDILEMEGIPGNIAEKIMEERIAQVSRGVAPENHYRTVDTAKLLGIPLINIHTPGDNSVYAFLAEKIKNEKPETVGEIIDSLKKIPEYSDAANMGMGPTVFSGSERSRVGKMILGMTGGTGGSEKIYEKLGQYGIGTVVDMHMSEKHREEAVKHYINVVIAGHIASDSLGMNIVLDELEKRGIEIIPCSGFIRYSRVK